MRALAQIGLLMLLFAFGGCKRGAEGGGSTGAHDSADPPTLSDLVQAGRPAVVDGEWHCRSRLSVLARQQSRIIRSSSHGLVIAGDGVDQYCLGDPLSRHADVLARAGCRNFCRLFQSHMDLEFTGSRLSRIRVHRNGRKSDADAADGKPFSSGVEMYETGENLPLYLNAPESRALELLGAPKRRAVVQDPEFGEVVHLEYDGLIVELDRIEGDSGRIAELGGGAEGGLVVGGMIVVPKAP